MLHLLIFTCLLVKATTSKIRVYGNTTADYGGDAHYRCAVDIPAGVLQVTWQRLFKDQSIENMATYSERFGQQINGPFLGKVIFTEASLNSTAITLKNVTWEDESCYICSFNVYPDGSKRKQACLTVQGISDVNTMVQPVSRGGPEGEDLVVGFRCSATGRPAPTIQWDLSSGATNSEEQQTTTVTNSDHTFTSSRNITLHIPPGWSGYVDCLVNSGATGQRRERIPFSSGPGPDSKPKDNKGLSQSGIALLVTATMCAFCIIGGAVVKRRFKGGRSENV
uniref:OX-2 membrane glycoprotein-like n=1 Tax=Monopterus albus TaxID=43700 RepID=UPI0009B36744|nr:OX-2 membrane glycoprotein-like [Monopterus albus]